MPLMRWKQPRPAERTPTADSLNRHSTTPRNKRVERYAPLLDQVEVVGIPSFLEDRLTRVEALERGASL